jgi:hypothetical protein
MKKTIAGAAVIKEREIYFRQWLDEEDLYLVLDGQHVHLPSLLEAIPRDVLLRAAASVSEGPQARPGLPDAPPHG